MSHDAEFNVVIAITLLLVFGFVVWLLHISNGPVTPPDNSDASDTCTCERVVKRNE